MRAEKKTEQIRYLHRPVPRGCLYEGRTVEGLVARFLQRRVRLLWEENLTGGIHGVLISVFVTTLQQLLWLLFTLAKLQQALRYTFQRATIMLMLIGSNVTCITKTINDSASAPMLVTRRQRTPTAKR